MKKKDKEEGIYVKDFYEVAVWNGESWINE